MMMLMRLPFILLQLLVLLTNSSYGINENAEEVKKLLSRSIRVIDSASTPGPHNVDDRSGSIRLEEFYDSRRIPFDNFVANFAPGPLLLDLLRSTDENSIPTVPLLKEPIPVGPHPHYIHPFPHINEIFTLNHPLIVLYGPPRSGKSLSLKCVRRSLQGANPSNLYIFIDLTDLLNSEKRPYMPYVSASYILDTCVSDHLRDLVKNLLVLNPSKITFLFDGVDQVRQSTINMLYMIQEFRNMKVNVIMSSNSDLPVYLVKNSVLSDFKDIAILPIVSNNDIKTYMTRYWSNKLRANNVALDPRLVDDYCTAFLIIMQNSPLPWTIGVLKQLADYFSNTNIQKPITDVSVYALPSNSQRPELSEIIQMAETMNFPKIEFYNTIFKNVKPHIMKYYGLIAMNMLCDRVHLSGVDRERQLLSMNAILFKLQPLIRPYSLKSLLPYLTFNMVTWPVSFVHDEFMYYFAARHVLSGLITYTLPYPIFWEILRIPELRYVAEYINNYVEHVPQLNDPNSDLWKSARSTRPYPLHHGTLDNLLTYKLDGLLSRAMEVMGAEQVLDYVHPSGHPPRLQISNLNVFGMISNTRNEHFERNNIIIPRRTIFQSVSRYNVILKYNMARTIRVSRTVLGFHWNLDEIIETTALQTPDKLRQLLSGCSPALLKPAALNAAGFQALRKFGPKSLDILRTLAEYGATFSEATDSIGRTLDYIAVQWADPNLLRIIHQEFMMTTSLVDKFDKFGRTILFAALDSSPFSMSTPDGFWPMINYIVQTSNLITSFKIARNIFESIDPFPFRAEDMPLQYRVLFTGEFPQLIPHAKAAFQCIPLKDWDLPTKLLSGRRNAVIKDSLTYVLFNRALGLPDHVTLSEIIIKHRSINRLSSESLLAYENAIVKIMTQEIPLLDGRQIERIFIAIVKNIQTHSELIRMRNIYTNLIHPIIPDETKSHCAHKIDLLFSQRETGQKIDNPPRHEFEIETLAMPTSMDVNVRLITDRELGPQQTSNAVMSNINNNNNKNNQIVYNNEMVFNVNNVLEPNNNHYNGIVPNYNDAIKTPCLHLL